MIENAIGLAVLLISLAAITLQRLYSFVPVRELKRLASRGDHLAKSLYRVAAYGATLRLFLWTVVSLCMAVGLLLIVPGMPPLVGFVILVVVAVASFVVLPSVRLTQRSAQFAASAAPIIVGLLRHIHGPLERFAGQANRFRDMPRHSRLYEKEDLLELIHRQKEQTDNRIHPSDLDLVRRALAFSETRAADVVQPRKRAFLVDADDTIGPVLLDQLHKQKQGSFLVYKDTPDTIIGSLALSDAVAAKHGGRVFDLIRSDLIFVHEDFTARQVLDAFHKTGHQVAIVINNAEEFVGVITLDHLLRSLLGEAHDDAVAYGDRRAVASYKPKNKISSETSDTADEATLLDSEPEETQATSETIDTSPEATEVIK